MAAFKHSSIKAVQSAPEPPPSPVPSLKTSQHQLSQASAKVHLGWTPEKRCAYVLALASGSRLHHVVRFPDVWPVLMFTRCWRRSRCWVSWKRTRMRSWGKSSFLLALVGLWLCSVHWGFSCTRDTCRAGGNKDKWDTEEKTSQQNFSPPTTAASFYQT